MKGYSIFFRLLGPILFLYILSRIDFYQLKNVLTTLNPYFYILGILVLIPTFLLRTLRLKLLIDFMGAKTSLLSICRIMAKGLLFGAVTPGKLGEFWRAKEIANNYSIPSSQAFFTTLVDRMIDLFVIALIALFGLLVILFKFEIVAPIILYFIIFFVFLSSFLLFKIGLRKTLTIFVKFLVPSPLRGRVNLFLSDFDKVASEMKIISFFKLLFFGIFYYFSSVGAYYLIALAIGISIPFWYLFLVVAMVWLILAIPISVLGLGTREAGFIYFLSILGIPSSLAVAFSLLALFYNVLLALPGAMLFLKQR